MSDNLTILGIDYEDVTGFKATDENDNTITYTNGGGSSSNDFIITLSYNDNTEMWEPDCTWAELNAAYNDEKNIVVCVEEQPDNAVADGAYNPLMQRYDYVVREIVYLPERSVLEQEYYFNALGVVKAIEQIYVEEPTLQTITKTYTPTESQQTETITPGQGYDAIEEVDVTVNAISSTYVGSDIPRNPARSVNGKTVTIPGPAYYTGNVSTNVAEGTEGTPTATKGTVSNNSISVTPSVTNTAGYISGGTKTGTAVSVSASELVSGTLSITSSGTKDVTNYASASVAAGSEGTPTATKGTVSNHSVSVTPSVTNTAGYISGGTKNGTAVSVSASELVSGSETKTANGTYDVTNLASLVVAIPFSTITVSSSNPTGGNNGDVWIKTS